MKNGRLIKDGRANIHPANTGAIAAPVVRATPVIPAAADRSSGRTTAMTYDCRVGTSIWLMLNRASSTRIASARVGISGTSSSRMLDGRCVKTIVSTRPNRAARRDASSADIRSEEHTSELQSHVNLVCRLLLEKKKKKKKNSIRTKLT